MQHPSLDWYGPCHSVADYVDPITVIVACTCEVPECNLSPSAVAHTRDSIDIVSL
jgi:hypothetical protein